jgi:hypothetical protein
MMSTRFLFFTLQSCLLCLFLSACAGEHKANTQRIGEPASGAQNQELMIDQEVMTSLAKHGFASVHIRVTPQKVFGSDRAFTWQELSDAVNAMLPGQAWEQTGMVQNQPEFLGYLSKDGLRALRKRGVAEFVARGDRFDGELN